MHPPKAKKIAKITKIFNEELIDHYDWLRDRNWPENINDEILDHIEKENEYYSFVMDNRKVEQKRLFDEIKARIKLNDQTLPILEKDFHYYSITKEELDYPIYCRKKSLDEQNPEIIFDQNKEAEKYNFFKLENLMVSSDQNLLAYSYDLKGSECYNIKVKDLDKNILLPDIIYNSTGEISWYKSYGFFYVKLDENLRPKTVFYHKLGDNPFQDELIYHEESEEFHISIDLTSDKKFLLINSSSFNNNEIFYIDLSQKISEPKIIIPRSKDQIYYAETHNEYFYIQINDHGKNFRLVKTRILDLERTFIELIPHKSDIYLKSFYIFKNKLVTIIRKNGLDQINISDFNNQNIKSIDFSEETYDVQVLYTEYNYNSLRFNYSSLNTPDTIIECDFDTNNQIIVKTKEIPSGFDKNLYEVKRLYAPTEDKLIPISLIYRKDRFTGDNPLYLYGYGSYGIATQPNFRPSIFSLIDRGFIYAIAHIRGGDELGYEWYNSAKFLNKKLTFTDFIFSIKYLINNGYTNKGNITISGTSAGGMLVGSVINMEPNLVKLAILKVPFVDVLNTMLDETLPLTPGEFLEWGNPKEESYYHYIISYSPYDNIERKNYPVIYVTAGLYDPRVTYWESAKWVAKIREYKTDDNLLLFKTNMTQGHVGASKRDDSLNDIASEYNFILKIYDIDI